MAPSLEESTKRYEALCDQMQDSVHMIHKQMFEEGFSVTTSEAVKGLPLVDTELAEKSVPKYIKVLEEYIKLVKLEKRRRMLFESIETQVSDNNERMKLKMCCKVNRMMIPFYKARELKEFTESDVIINQFEGLRNVQQVVKERAQQENND